MTKPAALLDMHVGIVVPRVVLGASLALLGCSASETDNSPRRHTPTPSQAGANPPARSTSDSSTAGSAGDLSGLSTPTPIVGLAGAPSPGAPVTPSGNTCASALVDTSPVTPVIWLVVDGSSSMNEPFDGRDRWTVLRSTLMDPGGVVDSLQAVAKFGLVIYSGGGIGAGSCVSLVPVQPALNNHAAIGAQYPMAPIGMGTPTDKALDYVVTNLPITNQAMLDARVDPTYVVLATDGSPNDMCGGDPIAGLIGGVLGGDVRQRVLDVVAKGTQAGMLMYVVSLAGADLQLQSHLEQVAMATASRTPPFVPASQGELVATIQRIVGSASCQIALNGMIALGQECKGRVTLNGADLACGSDDGWRLIDADTFTLTGTACEMFGRTASTLRAEFPCEVFTPE